MLFAPFIKAADLVVLLAVAAMLYLYVRAIFALRGDENRGFARNLCLGIVIGWSGSLVLYGNLAWVYWSKSMGPMVSPAAPPVRVLYTVLTLLGCSMHISTSLATGGRWWRTLGLLLLGEAILILALVSLQMRYLV